jgi:serine/threonine protein kinase
VHGDLRGVGCHSDDSLWLLLNVSLPMQSNILINDTFNVQLTDFGLTRFADSTTVSFSHAGSLRWMAPELINPEEVGLLDFKRSFQSDIYAFASVCFEVREFLLA